MYELVGYLIKEDNNMKSKERDELIKWANNLSDEELENGYYDAVFDSLGSVAEKMYDLGYDMRDIKEQEEYEKYRCDKADILSWLCGQRGIKLWEE